MDNNTPTDDDLNNAYMNMLNRNIPGVGNNPITPSTTTTTTTTTPAPTATHLTNKNTANTLLTNTTATDSSLTQKQRDAIDTLKASLKDALFVSEGEEPFQTVHISTSASDTTKATATSTPTDTVAMTTTTTSLPTEQEFRTLLYSTHLLPSFQSQQHQLQESQDDDNDDDNEDDDQDVCERSSDLGSILTNANPGSDKIAQALHTIFDYPLSSSAATTTAAKDDKVMLYRITDPSSSTRVHIWVLGWIDGDLIGLHTISIES
ncbi:hypothetical protein EC991_009200 [Linnemannia zychae]|nr:hypothetical protein EC991_009200 [Linnemannia zychae]